jgi:hypothetical protein
LFQTWNRGFQSEVCLKDFIDGKVGTQPWEKVNYLKLAVFLCLSIAATTSIAISKGMIVNQDNSGTVGVAVGV